MSCRSGVWPVACEHVCWTLGAAVTRSMREQWLGRPRKAQRIEASVFYELGCTRTVFLLFNGKGSPWPMTAVWQNHHTQQCIGLMSGVYSACEAATSK